MNIDEIFIYLKDNYPMCDWKIVPTTWSKGRIISWIPEKRFIIQISLSRYRMKDNQNEFISVNLDDKRNQSGEGSPCDSLDELSKWVKRIIAKYDPKLFEEVQISIFDL